MTAARSLCVRAAGDSRPGNKPTKRAASPANQGDGAINSNSYMTIRFDDPRRPSHEHSTLVVDATSLLAGGWGHMGPAAEPAMNLF